ncbi:MAG: hypothetical protein M0Z30_11340 [Actinomycetota bacterium]|nr:hypothetical protein [Actinomycetota bacterium]
MVIALVVLAAAAFVLALLLVVVSRRASVAGRRAGTRTEEMQGRLSAAAGELDRVEGDRRAAEVRAAAAEQRVGDAERRAGDAERRAGEAERRVAEAMRQAGEAERRADEVERGGGGAAAPRAVWELERLRIEREWLDVVGPGIGLPHPWDGTIAPVVAAELAVIRETIGTPSELRLRSPAPPSNPAQAAVTARISVEMLRTLARSGEEMDVVLGAGYLTVAQPVSPGERPPDLSALASVAATGGLELATTEAGGRAEARLRLS